MSDPMAASPRASSKRTSDARTRSGHLWSNGARELEFRSMAQQSRWREATDMTSQESNGAAAQPRTRRGSGGSEFLLWGGAVALALGCAGDAPEPMPEQTPPAEEAPMSAAVAITQPADGAELEAGPTTFVMEVQGLEIVAAGNMDPGSGHHHLIVNGDVDWSVPIANDPNVHYHMGLGQTEFTIDLPPGEHRVIAVVADGVHIPLDPPVADTVYVVVR